MPVTPPLAVRIISDGAAYNIDNVMIGDLTFANAAPGGFTTLSVDLGLPLSDIRDELSPYAEVEVVDTRSGEQVWYGRLEDPGRAVGRRSLSAVGGSSHASDVTRGVVYRDTRMDKWVRVEERVTPNATYGVNTDDLNPDDPVQVFTFPNGTQAKSSPVSRIEARYQLLISTGQYLGRVKCLVISGKASAGFQQELVGRAGPATEAIIASVAMTAASQTMQARYATDFTADHSAVGLRMKFLGATGTIGDDLSWTECTRTFVRPRLLDRFGADVATAAYYTSDTVPVEQIVEDVLGRFLPDYDRTNALVDTSSTVTVEQMAYEDGATAAQVLGDLMALVPTHWWAAWGNGWGSKGARFVWQPWPTVIGLDGLDTVVDEFTASGSAADLYNEVTVRYKNQYGHSHNVTVTGTSPALTRAGLTRRGFLDLGSQIGTKATALTAGANFLAAHRYPGNGGTIKVSRPITDWSTGRKVWPWQIRSGVLARVANLNPSSVDDLNPVPNGSTVFRVSDVTYSAKSNAATLTLDSYDRTVARALARLSKSAARDRRL